MNQMTKLRAEKSWVSKKLLRIMIYVFFALLFVSVLFHRIAIVSIIGGILSFFMFLLTLFFFYAYYKLSPQGGDLQYHVSSLVLNKIDENSSGKLLDIGCGSGVLSVELALKCTQLKISGIDYWGSLWGYSQEKCEQLAKDYNVSDRVIFERASASALPFEDESFDFVISNMVFHEVADTKDKRKVIKEALRVLKKGGVFVFQDLFLSKIIYGDSDKLIQYIEGLDIEHLSLKKTKELIDIPVLLRTPMFFGDAAILSGKM